MKITSSTLLVVLGLSVSGTASFAQTVQFNGSAYTQNFDSLPDTLATTSQVGRGPHALNDAFSTTGLDGWYGGNPGGSSTNTEFKAHIGDLSGSAGRGVLSLGSDSTDRALGALSTSNQVNNFGLYLTNATGETLTNFSLSYVGEQWRYGDLTVASELTFAYAIFSDSPSLDGAGFSNVESLSFIAPIFNTAPTNTNLDGNAPANQTVVSSSVDGIEWLPGHVLVLRWTAQDLPGQDPALAIDNLTFNASAIPEPSTYAALAGLVALGLAAARRRR